MKRIEPKFVERIWGRRDLAPWFDRDPPPGGAERDAPPAADAPIGEVWFENGPLLIKFLFTGQNLSVQVHPDDVYARQHHGQNGKTEMWYVLRAAPGARIALGFRQRYTREEVARAAASGAIVEMLSWRPACAGDTIFTPAGTVHALGAGLVVCEIQQTSDVTYRLYDFGRGRELHLDRALDVARLEPAAAAPRAGGAELARCPYFAVERLAWPVPGRFEPGGHAAECLIILEGGGVLNGQPFRAGEVWQMDGTPVSVRPGSTCIALHAYVPTA